MPRTPPPLWIRLGRLALWPLIGVLVGVFFARTGYREIVYFHYFRDQAMRQADPQADSKSRPFDASQLDEIERRDLRLRTEPAIRDVTWFGIPVATEYAGLDQRPLSSGGPSPDYLLPSGWRLRLQIFIGFCGGLIGWMMAQQLMLRNVTQ